MNEKEKEYFPPGIHHYLLGHGLAFISVTCALIDFFFIHNWIMAWICSAVALLGEEYAFDDLLGDYFHKITPVKFVDQWLKRNFKPWRNFCAWLDGKFGKKIQAGEKQPE